MNEKHMRMFAQALGLEVMSFLVDYQLPDGRDEHRSAQAVGIPSDKHKAALRIRDDLKAKGLKTSMITYYPGDYTVAELEAIMDERPCQHEYIPVYVADHVFQEAQQRRAKN